jgi:hypothetical protein
MTAGGGVAAHVFLSSATLAGVSPTRQDRYCLQPKRRALGSFVSSHAQKPATHPYLALC